MTVQHAFYEIGRLWVRVEQLEKQVAELTARRSPVRRLPAKGGSGNVVALFPRGDGDDAA
jgi:hypothetical protein